MNEVDALKLKKVVKLCVDAALDIDKEHDYKELVDKFGRRGCIARASESFHFLERGIWEKVKDLPDDDVKHLSVDIIINLAYLITLLDKREDHELPVTKQEEKPQNEDPFDEIFGG